MKLVPILFAAVISVSTAASIPEQTSTLSLGDPIDISVPFIPNLEEACLNRTGSNETFAEIMTTVFMAPPCFASYLDIGSLQTDAKNLGEAPKAKRVAFFNRYCPQVKTSLRCFTQVTDMVRKCVEPGRFPLYDTFVNTIPEAVDLICKDHGEIIFADGPNFKECSESLPRALDGCSATMAAFGESLDLASYGQHQCTALDKVRQCYKKELADCRVPRMIELFDLLYRPLVKASPCEAVSSCSEESQTTDIIHQTR